MRSASAARAAGTPRPGGAIRGRLPEVFPSEEDALLDGLTEPGLVDVRDRLLARGASRTFAADIVRAVRATRVTGAYALDAAARAIARSLPILPSPQRRRGSRQPHVFAFVGPTGGGKTTTLAKLGRRMRGVGRSVLFATLDGQGAAALERVGGPDADTDRTEVPFVVVRDATDLERAIARARQPDVVVLDTPGLSPRDRDGLAALALDVERMQGVGPMDVFLVLPATLSRSAVELANRAFAPLAPTACVPTKLDETDEPAALLSELALLGLPVAFLCDGMDTRGHLWRASGARFTDLLLTGRLA